MVEFGKVSHEKIDSFLWENKKKLDYMEALFSADDNNDKASDFTDDKLKVLCVYLSPASSRSVSNTHNALWTLAKKADKDHDLKSKENKIVVDCCYFPEEANMEIFEKNGIPYIFGQICHQPIEFYDFIVMSSAVTPEVFNVPKILKESGIPYTIEQRDATTTPLICHGGAGACEEAILYGPINDENGNPIGKSLVDCSMYGYGEETLTEIINGVLRAKEAGVDTHNKRALKDWMIDNQVAHDYLFFPEYYEWVYEDDKFTIKEIKCLSDKVPERVKFSRIRESNKNDMGWRQKIFNLSGDNADGHDFQISSGCSGASSNCSFCMEATVAGGYREKELDIIKNEMSDIRKYTAANTISFFSYNLNYYKHFMDLLASSAEYFSGVTLLNERLDVVANAPDQLKLAKRMGLKRFSGAVDGVGPRIRNGLMNKNLPSETLFKATENISALGLMHMKLGNIVTGYETKEDWDAMAEELEEMCRIRDRMGANHSYQQNFTPLVIYSNIALRHLERKTSVMNHTGEKTAGYFLDRIKPLGIRSKFNGKGSGTYIEQLILDFGPAGTDWITAMIRDENQHYVRFFGEQIREAAHRQLKKRGYDDPLFFTPFRPKDWIFPNDHIDMFTQRLKDMWWDRTQQFLESQTHEGAPMPRGTGFNHQLCLRTLANYDNTMTTEEARAQGLSCDKNKCQGCGMCVNKEEIQEMTVREISDKYSYDEIAEILSTSREAKDVRIIVKVDPKWFFANSTTLAHYITTKFLQASDEICSAFYNVGKTSRSWVSNNGQKDWASGIFVYNIGLRERVPVSEFNRVLDEVNAQLDVCKVVGIVDDTKEQKAKISDWNIWVGSTTEYALSGLADKVSSWRDQGCQVPVFIKSMQGSEQEKQPKPELSRNMFMAQKGKSVIVTMALPANISPYIIMQGITGKGYGKILEDFDFQCQDVLVPIDAVGKDGEHCGYSVVKGKYMTDSMTEYAQKLCYLLTR